MIDRKRGPEPASLARKTGWRDQDVLNQLYDDFAGKCYLTEQSVTTGGFEVDHRHPRGDGGDEYDWGNLYPIHPDANLRRQKKWPSDGLLHPDGRDGVERRVLQTIECDSTDLRCSFIAVDPHDKAAMNTVDELDRLHNAKQIKAVDLRNAISLRLNQVLLKALDVSGARRKHAQGDFALRVLERDFARLVSRDAPFTALIRSKVPPDLHDLFD